MSRHTHTIYIFCTLLLFCLQFFTENADAADTSTSYSIVLSSAPGKNLKWEVKKSLLFDGRTVYIAQTTISNSPWERLCLGFFSSHKDAASLLDTIKQTYPGAWIQRSSKNDIAYIISTVTPIVPYVVNKAPKDKHTSLTKNQLDSLMQRAKEDFTNKKYASTIRYLTALINAGDHEYSRKALELMGLARQRKGQNAHAVNIYEKYLALYPTGDGTNRVRQRLAGLLTATRPSRDKIRMSTDEGKQELTTYGSLSQFYRNNKSTSDDIGSITTLSQLITFLDLTTIQRSDEYDHRYQFASDHTYDFIGNGNNSEFRFIEAYYELSLRESGTSGRIGRQALRIGGILNRFDGLSTGYQFTPDLRLNLLAGYPVEIDNKTSINQHKTFYGATLETGTFLEHWSMSPFYFNQKVDGLSDRTSTGTEVRYRDKTKAFFGMIDYDLFYKEVDIVQFNANLILEHGRTAYINAFLRKTPILSTSNALIGQPESTIEQLRKRLNIEQIYQLARDRTANSQTITVGGSQQLSKNYQATADITLSRVGDTVASINVPATPGTGTDYFLSAQLVGNNLITERDTGVLGIRYLDTEPSDTLSLIANSRFPITRNWRINPRLQYDIRKLNDGRSQKKIRAIIKTDYRYLNKIRYDFEVGYDDTSENNNGLSLGTNNLFFNMGYRWDF